MAKERAEYCDAAEVGPLARPSPNNDELSERELLPSSPRPVGCIVVKDAGGLPFGRKLDCGADVLPIGVANRSCGKAGLVAG